MGKVVAEAKITRLFFWPFAAVWKLPAFVLTVTGRVLGVLLAVGLMIVGIGLTMTVAGAPFGIPTAVLGSLLMIKSVF